MKREKRDDAYLIRTKTDYRAALKEIETLMSAFNGRVITASDTITWQSISQYKAERKAATP